MYKSSLKTLLALVLCLLGLSATANDIEPGKEYYSVLRTQNPIVLDGSLSEWVGIPVVADPKFSIPKFSGTNEPRGTLVLFEEYNGGTWTGPDDQTSAVQITYDATNVYLGVVVTDDYHENSANSAWNGDSVQLMIASADRTLQVALYNYALGGVETNLGTDTIIMHEAGPGGTEAFVNRNTNTHRTTYEIKMPAAALGLIDFENGPRFGLGMSINDGDQFTPGQKGWGGLGVHAIVHGKTPSETALMTLVKPNDIEPGKEAYTAVPLPNPFVLDGSLSEWSGVPVLADPKFSIPKFSGTNTPRGTLVLFEEYNGGTWTGPDDQTSAVQIAFDTNNIYLGVVVTDDYHENSANSAWNGDSVQLMIASADRTLQVALYNYALGGVETNLGIDTIIMHEAGPGGTEAIVSRNTNTHKTFYEIKMPAAALGLTNPLAFGDQFGLGMSINDGDQFTPGQKGWGGLGVHSIVHGKTPSETALITLGTAGASSFFFLSAINPGVNTFKFRATDVGTSIVNPATATLRIDGQLVPLVASPKVLDATDFTYTRSSPFPAGSHTYAIEVTDTQNHLVTDSGTFVSVATSFLATTARAVSVDTTKPGFVWRVFQNDAAHTTPGLTVAEYLAEAELALVGKLPDPNVTGGFLANLADTNAQGAALAPGTLDGTLARFEITNVIYLNEAADGVIGNPAPPLLPIPVPAGQMPGIPGINGGLDSIDAEIRTFVEFPAGVTRLGISANDHFRIQAGLINNPTNGVTFVAEGVGTVPASAPPLIFNVFVETAGVYPLRVVYQELTLTAWVSLYTVKANGDPVLLGDVANGGLKTYRVGVVPGPSFSLTATLVSGQPRISWSESGVVLQESTNLTSWVDLPAATSPYTPAPPGRPNVFYRLKK